MAAHEQNKAKLTFLGVSTSQSYVHKFFGGWASCLGAELGLISEDLQLKSHPDVYRKFVRSLRQRSAMSGALITSHKTAVYETALDLFDVVTVLAECLGEIGMVYWRGDNLVADANDPISNREILRRLLVGQRSWEANCRKALILGGGGAGIALAYTLAVSEEFACSGITIVDVDPNRIATINKRAANWNSKVPIYALAGSGCADHLVSEADPGTLIVNATGLGKDAPGSPVSGDVLFPQNAHVWEFNYRFIPGQEVTFCKTASAQAESRNLVVEDGWDYFVWGWLVAMSSMTERSPDQYYDCFSRVASDR